MKIDKKKKAFIYILLAYFVIQGSITGFSIVNNQFFSSQDNQITEQVTNIDTSDKTSDTIDQAYVLGDVAAENIEISADIQKIIRDSDPDNFEKNMDNYRKLLINLDVHLLFKDEIERLLTSGYKINDILIAYEFIYDNYGKKEDIELVVKEKNSGKKWSEIFDEYYLNNAEFTPRVFETDYLEKLMETPGITKDDIMIADRVANKSSLTLDEVFELRFRNNKWKVINASLGIINSRQFLPYVPVTTEQINKYMSGNLTEEKVVEAIVIADKFHVSSSEVVEMVKNGLTRQEIYAGCLEGKYY